VDILDVETKEGKHPNIKLGCPFDLSKATKLGRLLALFGVPEENLSSGEPLNIDEILAVGRKVQVLTKDVVKENGTFADIVSMKPAK
jgi:hypothetical protein